MALSLVIPTYNRGEAIGLLLESLKKQTLPTDQWEVLMIDDGSTAANARILDDQVAACGLPIRVWHRENGGPAVARNFGIENSRHEVVLFLNDDLELESGHLESHAKFHENNRGTHVAAHGRTPWHPESGNTPIMQCLRKYTFNYDHDLTNWEQPLVRFCTSSLSVKRELLESHRFDEVFREPSFEDTELAYRLVRDRGLVVATLAGDPAWHLHPHDENAFRRRAAMNGRNAPLLIERAPEFFDRLIRPFMKPAPRLREGLAWLNHLRGNPVEYWRQVEIAEFVRAYWKAGG
ncbi:MAG: glycosyltransferase family 2 protein [Candidatus Sumerlaeia bacterium]|nr:glycosyltransferase family 2 protein [Candidatus Sumerlaeia bacterium]